MYYEMTAVQLATAIRNKDIGIEELTKAYIDRIERYDGINGLNTIAELNENAIDEAKRLDNVNMRDRGDLFGLPILVKDNIDVYGLHTTAGSIALSDNIATKDANVVSNLRRNGAIILGKTNMTEFANYTTRKMPGGYSSRGGQVINAYDSRRGPSGSSSGSAVAMSAGLCSAAIGTDTSFSVLVCAIENGVTGLKPSHGSLSSEGIIPIARTLDSAGAITRDLQDAILVYSAMRDKPLCSIEPLASEKINIAVNYANRELVAEEQFAQYNSFLDILKEQKVTISDIEQPFTKYQRDVMNYEFKHDLEDYLAHSNAKRKTLKEIVDFYEQNPETMMKYGIDFLKEALEQTTGKLDEPEYKEAMSERKRLRHQIIDSIQKYDACIMTGPTNIMHFVGIPTVSLRLYMSADGMPHGIILYGADESRLFAAALTLEKYCKKISIPNL